MNALRDFWAKNLLNKLILLGLTGVVCCCPLGLAAISSGGSTVTTTPTDATEQSIASSPVAPANPTETPVSAETPIPLSSLFAEGAAR